MSNEYFNPFPTKFIDTLNFDIYVDKTDLIIQLNKVINTNKKYICVSRPRRFGKSITADMLVAYYRYISNKQKKSKQESVNQNSIFNNKNITKYKDWDKYLGKFNVIKLDMSFFFSSKKTIDNGFSSIAKKLKKEIEIAIPDFNFEDEDEDDLPENKVYSIFSDIFRNTERKIVLIIDEWDFLMRNKRYKYKNEAQERYTDFLTALIKDKNYIALAYMTGILPIKKYGNQSSIGFFGEYSMTSPLWMAKYVGFTEEEVEALWNKFQNSSNNQNSESKVKKSKFNLEHIKKWYDGYILRDNNNKKYHIYTPLSISEAFTNKKIQNYWNSTETFEALSNFITFDFDGLKEDIVLLMKKIKLKINIENYKNDMKSISNKDEVLTMLIHLGYLGYIEKSKKAFIPNKELMKEFKKCINKNSEYNNLFAKLEISQELLEATWACDQEKVAMLLEKSHNNADNKKYNSEAALGFGIQLAYYKAYNYYTVIPEVDSGRGYADIFYIPKSNSNVPAMVIELKYEEEAKTAISQIKERNYPQRLDHYKNNLLLVGINYNKEIKSTSIEYKHHTCTIEKFNEEKYLTEEERKWKEIEKIKKKRKRKNEEEYLKEEERKWEEIEEKKKKRKRK